MSSLEIDSNLNYDEVKKQITVIQGKISNCKNVIRGIEQQEVELDREQRNLQDKFEHEISTEANKELRKYTNDLSEPFANQVSTLEDELLSLEKSYNDKMEKFLQQDLSDYYYSETEMLDEVQKTLTMLNDRLITLLGERFQKELNAQLNSVTFEIQEEHLEEICDYFSKLTDYFDNVQDKKGKFSSIDNIVKKLNGIGMILDTGNKQLTFVVLLILCFIFYFAFKFIFPFYVVALSVLAFYNVKLSNKIYATSVLSKAIQDNLEKIEKMYHDKALAQFNQEKSVVETEYKNTKANLEQQLTDAKNKLESVLMSAKARFNYDDNNLREKRDSLLKMNSNKKLDLERQKLRERENYNNLIKEYEMLKEQFDRVASELRNTYVNVNCVGDSIILDPKFLLDIDSVTKTPRFFEFNFGSSLFLYRNIDDATNFIRLFVVQLRAKLKASCINAAVFDDTFMCQNFLSFTDTEDSKNENVMKLILNKDELKDYIHELSDLSITRTTNIKREFNNIVEYNNFMLQQNSLPEPYKFLFVQNVDINVLQETKFKQLLLNGSDLGIYIFIFIQLENFSKGKESSRNLVKYFNSIYTFEIDTRHKYEGSNTVIQSKAQEFVLERIIER